ncbi:outer membrane beta-barrel protein [Salmonella enterica]|nr:outer membrane beta-barrel protein [Salmonella enterica]EFQ6618156.1 outer membrane beta-barrel protein [Salmonella enterica]
MRLQLKVALCVALGVLPGVAIGAVDGLYVGGNVGWSDFSQGDSFTEGRSNNTLGVGLYSGYQFSSWFSLEGGLNYLGEAKGVRQSEMIVQGVQLSGKFGYTDGAMQLYTRLGGMFYRSDVSGDEQHGTVSGHDLSPLVAAGIEISINPQWTTRVEYQWVTDIQNSAASDASLDNSFLSLGVTYHFGALHLAQTASSSANTMPPSAPLEETAATTLPSLSLLYTFNQSDLSAENRHLLDAWLTERVKQKGGWGAVHLRVEGYSSPEGSQHNNKLISERRVAVVKAYLMQQGIVADNVVTEAKGETLQFDLGDMGNRSSPSLNRRVEVNSR